MSDGFDKEAEREKLREKFAEDERKREHTQRMSELLLQGATMTNRHCEECGDPIFRHDGREFCPTCHATEDGYVVPAEGSTPAGSAAADGETTSAAADEETTSAAADGETTSAGSGDVAVNGTPTPQERGERSGTDRENAGSAVSPSGRRARADRTAEPRFEPATVRGAHSGDIDDASGDIDDARASLTRTLARFARAAERTDDPRRARDHLKAAREAAETLSALER